ncbi:patatin [Maribellus comscasis]|uniref:Patatin n=1 Tax=Maribellus comscasis TaxID=2681766 RepID=A0A6I6JV88_9BACT|nr:patatin-like phospholipase family protein [Maribellus comscasis]QGY44998.1 patatin [Maribellus comscasis]
MPGKKVRFGIALSGGGARGIAHIGVLETLEKYGIKPKIISGTSMGAIVGAFYAAGYPPKEILEIVSSRKFHKLINWHLPFSGLIDMDKVQEVMVEKIEKDDFSALKIPFYCAVTNLNSGLFEIKSKGKLFQWVLASASIPVVFEPQIIDGQTYVDGGLLNNLPAASIRDKCEVLIGVHVNHNGPEDEVKGLMTVAERCFRLGIAQNVEESKKLCDFLIEPPEARDFTTFNFNKAREIYEVGKRESERYIAHAFDSVDLEKILELQKSLAKNTKN